MENNINNEIKNNQNSKKRTFTESEQSAATYNVGMKKQKSQMSRLQQAKALAKLKEVNPDLKLETIEQGELLTKNAGKNHIKYRGSNKVKVIFLGGIGEIGKNMTAIEYGDDMVYRNAC